MSARNWTPGRWPVTAVGLAVGAVLAAWAPTALAAGPGADRPAARAVRVPLPDGFGPCIPGTCPDPFPGIDTGTTAKGRDNAVNIFVGGDFHVRRRAAEAEGRVVVLGTFDQDKAEGASTVYNIGVVGVGSLVQPPPGSDFLTTGRDVHIAAGERLLAEGGVVRYAGSAPGPGRVAGTLTADPAAVARYAGTRDRLTAASECYARVDGAPRTATGTVRNVDGTFVFTGDDTSALQVFNVDADLAGSGGGMIGIRFARIPATATVLVNVLGSDRRINTFSGTIVDTDNGFNPLRTRLLWNFPDATNLRLDGGTQFQGSVLVGQQTSQTAVTMSGINGRFFTTGNLTHTSSETGGGGQEFHAYPFNGDLPDCAGPQPAHGKVSVLKRGPDGAPLAGAHFELWRESNHRTGLQTDGTSPDTRLPGSCVTDAQGGCTVELPVGGPYYWRETQAPQGYELPENPVTEFTVAAADVGTGLTLTIPNQKEEEEYRGSLQVLKKDAKTKRPLSGAVFEVWEETNDTPGLQMRGINADVLVKPGCATDRQGGCTFTELPEGQYYLVETAVPEGYVLPRNRVTGPLTLDARTPDHKVVVTLHNERDDHGKGKGGKGDSSDDNADDNSGDNDDQDDDEDARS